MELDPFECFRIIDIMPICSVNGTEIVFWDKIHYTIDFNEIDGENVLITKQRLYIPIGCSL